MRIVVTDQPPRGAAETIARGPIEHARAAGIAPRNHLELGIFLHDDRGRTVGGVTGATVWGWLHIRELWVRAMYRGAGWGSRLIEAAECEARLRWCRHAYLDTFDFQGPRLLPAPWLTRCLALEDFPNGHLRHFVRKRLGGL